MNNDDNTLATLFAFLNELVPLTPKLIALVKKETFLVNIKKNTVILNTEEDTKDTVFLIISGLVRGYILSENKDITVWLMEEKNLIGNIRGNPEEGSLFRVYLQAIEDTSLLVFSHSFIDELYDNYPEANTLARRLLARQYHLNFQRSIIARIPKAEERYKQFFLSHRNLKSRISNKYLCSYLGMREETLSRIAKKNKILQ